VNRQRLYPVPPHTLFAAAMAVVPRIDAQLLGVGDFGSSLTFLIATSGDSEAWIAFVRPGDDGRAALELTRPTDEVGPAAPLTQSDTNEAADAFLDAVSREVEALPPAIRSDIAHEGFED
jgi:hypothetical protein